MELRVEIPNKTPGGIRDGTPKGIFEEHPREIPEAIFGN